MELKYPSSKANTSKLEKIPMYLLGIKQVMSEFEEYITLMSYMHQDYEELWRDRLPPKQDKLGYFNVYDVLEKA